MPVFGQGSRSRLEFKLQASMRRVRSLGKGRVSTFRFVDEYYRVFALLGRVDCPRRFRLLVHSPVGRRVTQIKAPGSLDVT